MDETATLKGRLLVATPALLDPNFFRTVVLMVEHNDEGAAGVVLNRPSDTSAHAGSPLEDWEDVAADPPLVFVGGPVQPAAAVCLARASSGQSVRTASSPSSTASASSTSDVSSPTSVRPSIGSACSPATPGWGAGQLEDEIEEGAWYVLDADPEDALCSQPGGLWRFVLKRQGGHLALVVQLPVRPDDELMKLPKIVSQGLQAYGRIAYPIVRGAAEPILRQVFSTHPDRARARPAQGGRRSSRRTTSVSSIRCSSRSPSRGRSSSSARPSTGMHGRAAG